MSYLSHLSRYAGFVNTSSDWGKLSIQADNTIKVQPFLPGFPLKDPNLNLHSLSTSQLIILPTDTEEEDISGATSLETILIRASIHTGLDVKES